MNTSRQRLLHHLATAAGFVFLILWFVAGRASGILDYAITWVPESHAGAGLMLGIMIMMTPGFLIWKYANRWVERKLNITGRYYEDGIYKQKGEK